MDARTSAEKADDGAARPPTHKELRLVVLGVLLPVFVGSLDTTILASALPTIGRVFNDIHSLPWLITIYLLAATAMMPLYGKIADTHGRRFTLRVSICLYIAGSLVCALAPSMLVLILGRAIQGLGGAGMSGIGIVVLGDVAAPKERGKYYTYFSMTYITAGASGPVLGGFLSEHVYWSAVFWVGVPLGLLSLFVTSTLLRKLPRYDRPHRLDVIGAMLIVVASVSFMLGLSLAGVRYPLLSLPVLALFGCALVVGGLFVLRLLRAPEPLIPLYILRNPIVRCAVIASGFGWGSIVGLNIFVPMYLQSVIGLTPTDAGLAMIVLMVSLNCSAGIAGQVLCRVTQYKVLPMAALVVGIGAALVLAWWADGLTLLSFEILLVLIGAGFGPTPSLASVAVQNVVERHNLGIALGSMNFSRNLFSTILVAVLGALVVSATSSLGPVGGSGPEVALAPAAADAFRRVFFMIAGCLTITLIALALMEQRPLRSDLPGKG